MKRITSCLLILSLVMAHTGFCQPETNTPPTKADYLKKSKSQKIAGFIFLGIGAGLVAIAAPGNVDFDVLPALVIGAGAAVIISIPLFIASGKNKRRAKNATAFIEIEHLPAGQPVYIASASYPAIGLKLNFH